jgi:hypothetical protein
MNDNIHMMMTTTLSMTMTLIFYCSLEETRVNDSLFQNIIIDIMRDMSFYLRCLLDKCLGKYSL